MLTNFTYLVITIDLIIGTFTITITYLLIYYYLLDIFKKLSVHSSSTVLHVFVV
jgi:hypothetical protein